MRMREIIDLVEDQLFEMVVRHHSNNPSLVLAHNGNIWVIGYDDEKSILDDIEDRTGFMAGQIFDLEPSNVNDTRPDIFAATIHKDKLYVNGMVMDRSPRSSLLVKKIVNELGLDGVVLTRYNEQDYEVEEEIPRHQMVGNIPDVVYHGTTTRHIRKILRTGIAPNDNENWSKVGKFRDLVFFASDPHTAIFHANSQADGNHHVPVLIATRLPDRARIVADYDVSATFYGPDHEESERAGYDDTIDRIHGDRSFHRDRIEAVRKHSPKTDFTREIGIFGYRGRVPASHFVSFTMPIGEDAKIGEDNTETFDTKEDLLAALEIVEEFGFYDPEMRFLDDEDDEDFR